MLSRIPHTVISLVAAMLVVVACSDGHTPTEDPTIPVHTPTAPSASASVVVPTLTSVPAQPSEPTPATENLPQEIPPCTPVLGSSVDPCEPDAPPFEGGVTEYSPGLGDQPLSVREMLDDDPPPPAWIPHLMLRGTYLPRTVRCTAGDPFRIPSYLRDEFGDTSNELSIKCYVDVRANAYVLGSGPSTLTILLFRWIYGNDDEQTLVEELRQQIETGISDYFAGREHIMFLGPPVGLSSEVWRFMGNWDVQRRDDGTVIAVHPDRDLWASIRPDEYQTHLSKLEMELPALTQAVTTAHQARVSEYEGRIGADESLPMLVSNANQLRQYYTEVGAYAPGPPVPAQPPPPCGLAVPDQADNPGLMRDCINLLAAKDALRGTATLNWSVDTPISDWDGVTVQGSPSRVKRLVLVEDSLTGTLPPELGRLDGLEYLWLGYNQPTGEIPAALGGLSNLKSLTLNQNRLTGAIPRDLGRLSRLEAIWLNENQLSGEIPASLGDLGNLRQLLLAGNRLSGAIPPVLGDLSNLEHLKLNYNQLTGEIPAALENLSNLEDLLLGDNQLTGCVPPALRNVEDNDFNRLGLQDCATP